MSVESTSISLLRRLRQSDAELDWLRFSNLYAPLVFYWGRGQGLDATDAADLVQEVMTKLVVKLREFEYDPKLKFRAWLRTVSVNQARDLQRAATRRKATDSGGLHEPAQPGVNSVDLFDQQEYCAYLVTRGRDLIRSEFEPLTWDACWKYAVEGRSAGDVATELGITANAVRIAKCRVFARLRKELEGLIE
jgi:RNA polymerase sigma-70 factor, ECF subfamily